MPISSLRLGTRRSALALWQANEVARLLEPLAEPRRIDLVELDTHGDRDQASALSTMGGFGVFTKAIQLALLDDRADVAVHSLKDLPTVPTEGTVLAATPRRGPTGDAFVSKRFRRFDDLPYGATVGTSSLRRRAQLLNRRPDLKLVELRGNVATRLRKLNDLDLDGIVLAEAGLVRLELDDRIAEVLDEDWMLPAVGQGAIGLECRERDSGTRDLVDGMNDLDTWNCIRAERAMLAALGGGCLIPIGATTRIAGGRLTIRGAVLNGDGSRRIVATHEGEASAPLATGQELAAKLILEGANELLATCRIEPNPS